MSKTAAENFKKMMKNPGNLSAVNLSDGAITFDHEGNTICVSKPKNLNDNLPNVQVPGVHENSCFLPDGNKTMTLLPRRIEKH